MMEIVLILSGRGQYHNTYLKTVEHTFETVHFVCHTNDINAGHSWVVVTISLLDTVSVLNMCSGTTLVLFYAVTH